MPLHDILLHCSALHFFFFLKKPKRNITSDFEDLLSFCMASSVISQALKAFESFSLSLCLPLLCLSVSCDPSPPFPFFDLFWLLLCLTCDFSAAAGAVHPSGGTYSLTRTTRREGPLRLGHNDLISRVCKALLLL